MPKCSVDGCNCYPDFDVYYRDGTSTEMCSNHAGLMASSPIEFNIEAVIPQHGSDTVNIPIEEE